MMLPLILKKQVCFVQCTKTMTIWIMICYLSFQSTIMQHLSPDFLEWQRSTETRMNFLLLSGEGSSINFSPSLAHNTMIRGNGPEAYAQTLWQGKHMQLTPAGLCMGLDLSANSIIQAYNHAPIREKPSGSKCAVCGKVFATPRSMYDHKAAVHDNVSYICVCGKKYKYRPGLKSHQRNCVVRKNSLNLPV